MLIQMKIIDGGLRQSHVLVFEESSIGIELICCDVIKTDLIIKQ